MLNLCLMILAEIYGRTNAFALIDALIPFSSLKQMSRLHLQIKLIDSVVVDQ